MTASISKTLVHVPLFAFLAASAEAVADPPPKTLDPAVTIRYSELDLTSPQAARILYGRIRVAAQQVCGTSSSIWDPGRWSKWKLCYAEAVDTAVRRVNQPALTSLHNRLARPMVTGGSNASELPQVSIRFTRDELARPEGVQALYSHIERAAERVCRRKQRQDLTVVQQKRACERRAVTAAVGDIDAPELNALHQRSTPRSPDPAGQP